MPILINELHTEVLDTPEDSGHSEDQASNVSASVDWLQMNCLG